MWLGLDPSVVRVNPARAGMIPTNLYAVFSTLCKPRASGDDPVPFTVLSKRRK